MTPYLIVVLVVLFWFYTRCARDWKREQCRADAAEASLRRYLGGYGFLAELRAANVTRQKEWDTTAEGVSLSYRGNELAGEVGELCNILKKLERESLGIKGSRAKTEDAGEEGGDVLICLDLIFAKLGLDLANATRDKFNKTSDKVGLLTKL